MYARDRQPIRRNIPDQSFQPKTEWKEEDAALVLLLHLPRFLKEQVRILTNESISYIKVHGERILRNNRRSHFDAGYNIPKNYNLSQLKSEFSDGILTIRIPKIIPAVQRSGPRELEAATSQEGTRPQDANAGQPKPEKKGEEIPSGRTSTSFVRKETEGTDVQALSPRKAASESISQKGQDESPQKAHVLTTTKEVDEKTAGLDGEKVDQNVPKKKEAYGKPVEEKASEEKSEESKIAESIVLKKKEDGGKGEEAAVDDKEKSNKDISNEAKTKFDDGIFTINVPKVIPAQISTGPWALEATSRQEAPIKSGSQKSEAGVASIQTWTTNADGEITEARDVEDVKGTNEGMSQKGQDQIPSKPNFPLMFTKKLQIDDQATVGQVGDQNAIEKDKQKSVDQEKEGEAKDVENASSSSSKPVKDKVTTVVTERRYMVDKHTIISVTLAVGAYVLYNIYGQSRKKKSVK